MARPPQSTSRNRRLAGDEAGLRVCLCCQHTFLSEGSWNRTCPDCADDQKREGLGPRALALPKYRLESDTWAGNLEGEAV